MASGIGAARKLMNDLETELIGERAQPGDVRAIQSIVECEGVRVNVERSITRRVVQIMTALEKQPCRVIEIDESAIEDAPTDTMVQHVIARIRECAADMRGDAACEMFERGVALSDGEYRARLVAAIVKHASNDERERLAIELMATVEAVTR